MPRVPHRWMPILSREQHRSREGLTRVLVSPYHVGKIAKEENTVFEERVEKNLVKVSRNPEGK